MSDRYKNLKKIGAGSFGTAYIAQVRSQPTTQVVIKMIALDKMEPQEVEESIKEAQVLSLLDHPCIIRHIEHFLVCHFKNRFLVSSFMGAKVDFTG